MRAIETYEEGNVEQAKKLGKYLKNTVKNGIITHVYENGIIIDEVITYNKDK